MIDRRSRRAAIPLSVLVLGAAQAAPLQEVLTPARYFECQIAAQRATVVGLEERARTYGKVGQGAAQKRAAGEQARHRVTLAFYGCSKQSASTMGAYAHRHQQELLAYLNENPHVKAQMDALGERVMSLSARMPAVSPSAKR